MMLLIASQETTRALCARVDAAGGLMIALGASGFARKGTLLPVPCWTASPVIWPKSLMSWQRRDAPNSLAQAH